MKNMFKIITSSVLGVLLSAQAFGSLHFSVTGDTTLSGKVATPGNPDSSTSFSSRGVSVFADYQVMTNFPMSLGAMGSFHDRSGANQNEFAPTAKFWMSSDMTGIEMLQPYLRTGYAFSWVANPTETATNNGLILNIGNTFPITDTVSAVAAYTFNLRTYKAGDVSVSATSHGASIGFSAELL